MRTITRRAQPNLRARRSSRETEAAARPAGNAIAPTASAHVAGRPVGGRRESPSAVGGRSSEQTRPRSPVRGSVSRLICSESISARPPTAEPLLAYIRANLSRARARNGQVSAAAAMAVAAAKQRAQKQDKPKGCAKDKERAATSFIGASARVRLRARAKQSRQ